MLNQFVLVGRLTKDPELVELENGKKVSNITLAIPRNYKNSNGEYDIDYIDCTLWNNVAENTSNYCKKGDLIGVKGKMEVNFDKENNKKMTVVGERVTFLSSRNMDKPENQKDL